MPRRLGVVTRGRSPQGDECLYHLAPAGPSVYRRYAVAARLQYEFRGDVALDCVFKISTTTLTHGINLHRGHKTCCRRRVYIYTHKHNFILGFTT